jgi:hypothetical protein
VVLKVSDRSLEAFAYGTITLYGPPFLKGSAGNQVGNSFGPVQCPVTPYNPNAT